MCELVTTVVAVGLDDDLNRRPLGRTLELLNVVDREDVVMGAVQRVSRAAETVDDVTEIDCLLE